MKKLPILKNITDYQEDIYNKTGVWEKLKYRKTISHVQFYKLDDNIYKLTLSHCYVSTNLFLYRVTLKNIYSKNKHNVIYSTFEQALEYYANRQNHLKNYAIEVN